MPERGTIATQTAATMNRVLLLVVLLIVTGCNVQQQVRPEAAAGAGGLVPTQEDKDIGRVGVRPGFDLKRYRIVAVESFPVADSEVKDEGDRSFALGMTQFFQQELVRRVRDTGLFESVVAVSEAGGPAASPDLVRLQGRITRLGRGSRAARHFGGIYGAGQTRVEAELFLVDGESRQVGVAAADRRLSRVSAGDEFLVKMALGEMARDLGKFLVRLSQGKAPGR
jgi:Domain of unknown function (DUF4410)